MLFIQLLAFVLALVTFLNLIRAKQKFQDISHGAAIFGDLLTVALGVFTFWLPFAFGWIG